MTSPIARVVAVAGIVLVLAGATAAGSALPVREPRPAPPIDPEGRTVTVCPAAPTINLVSTTTWGALTARPITASRVEAVPAGRGLTLTDRTEPIVMTAEGRQNREAAAAAYARQGAGPDRGLSLARCGTPSTSAWFTGLVSDPEAANSTRTQVVLINADAAAAEVDLVFFGPDGPQVAPGARGVAVPARGVRTVALETLLTRAEPVGLQVRATRGRVTALVQQHTNAGAQPAGTDWQVPAAAPATEQVVAGVPDGPGPRTLVLTNPGQRRFTASVEVLTPDGTFAPAGAGAVDVNAESTAVAPLNPGLAGAAGAVRIRADQPFVATVASRSSDDPAADVAYQPATAPLSSAGIGAVAVAPGVRGALLVSNSGEEEAVVPARVVDTDGVELKNTELRVRPGTTTSWVIDGIDKPAAVTVGAPDRGRVYAGLVLTSGADPAGGLTTSPLSVPAQEQGGGVEPVYDERVGR